MSRQEKRLQQIERSALREAQKALRQHPGQPVTREELQSIRVQMLTVAERITLASGGVLCIGAGIYFLGDDRLWWLGIVLTILGCIVLIFGVIGRKRTLRALDESIFEIVVELVFRALD